MDIQNHQPTLDKRPIVVLGATGRVGGVVAKQLLSKGYKIRAVSRHSEQLKELGLLGAEAWTGSIEDQDFLNTVFTNAKAAFVLTPGDTLSSNLHEDQRRYNQHIVTAIRYSGMKQIVFLSSWGAELPAESGTIYGCYLMEKLLNEVSGLSVVHLRAVWFMDNFLYNIDLIKMAGINGLAIEGNYAFPCIDSRDIGIIAADYLSTLNFAGVSIRYLQGLRDYTMNEVTAIVGRVIGKPSLKYVKFPGKVMVQGLKSTGTISVDVATLLVETNQKINKGIVHGEPRNELNTTPTDLEEFVLRKFLPAYNSAPQPSLGKKIQGLFLRLYLWFATK